MGGSTRVISVSGTKQRSLSNELPDSVGSDSSQSREMDGRCPDLCNSSLTALIVESRVEYAVLGMSVSVSVPVPVPVPVSSSVAKERSVRGTEGID